MHGFRPLAHLLHHDHLRQRVAALLVTGAAASHMRRVLDVGCPKHAEWRWGTIGSVVARMLQVEAVLVSVWDPQKFSQDISGSAKPLAEGDLQALDLDALTRAIRGAKFWAYT